MPVRSTSRWLSETRRPDCYATCCTPAFVWTRLTDWCWTVSWHSLPGFVPRQIGASASPHSSAPILLDVALIHLSADGRLDAEVPDNVRIYHLADTHHGGGALPLDNHVFTGEACRAVGRTRYAAAASQLVCMPAAIHAIPALAASR